jgi:hypothetical protein
MTVAGNSCLVWPAALQLWRRRAPEAVAGVQRDVYALCTVLLASEVLIVIIHLV